MPVVIGLLTVRDAAYHPNRRLQEAARQAGCRSTLIHPYRNWPAIIDGRLQVTGTDGVFPADVVIPRQGAQISDPNLTLLRQLARMGMPLVNGPSAVAVARNKFLTQQALTAAGVPCPDTVYINGQAGLFHAVDRLGGYPVVVKPVSDRQGEGVWRIDNTEDAHRLVLPVLDARRGLMIQRYLPPDGRRDIRALVIGGRLLCAAQLTPPDGDFRANFHLGSAIRSVVPDQATGQTALAAAAAVGCDVAGVDVMVDRHGRPFVVEVNYSPGFRGLEAATGLDIAGHIVRFAAARCAGRQHRQPTASGSPHA